MTNFTDDDDLRLSITMALSIGTEVSCTPPSTLRVHRSTTTGGPVPLELRPASTIGI
jgi:hypothetical protein